MAQKKPMTIEDLAAMMQRNFPSKEDLKDLRFEFKSDIQEVKTDIREVKFELREMRIELEEVHEVVDRIDGKDLPNLKRRVTVLETIVKPAAK